MNQERMSQRVWQPGTEVVARYSFKGSSEEDLVFQKGDIMTIVTPTKDPNWYKARHVDCREGLIPANYIQRRSEVKLHAMPWFHGKITRDEAEILLQPREDGLFLVRESTNFPGDYTLCVCYKNKVEHYRVIYKENKLTIDEEEYFENLSRLVELQKIRLQNETQRVVGPPTLLQAKIELKKLLPTFNPEVNNMHLFLALFERQMKLLDLWVLFLIGALPSDVTSLIACEPEEKCRDYSHIRGMLLQLFKLTAEKFRELFSRHRKNPNGTWKDYYFEGWLNELKIDSFDGLKNLMIANQMKKKCSPECKEHYLDIWEEFYLPRNVSFRKPERPPKREYSHQVPNERSPLRCCGKRVIKSRCPTCNLNASQRTDVATNHINAYTARTRSLRLTLIDITFCGIKGRVCADTGSSHSIAGERMFQIFKDKGLLFQETTLAMSLADGQQTTGTDFLSSAGLVLDVKNTCWYFWDNPTHQYPFGEELDTLSIVEKMSCQLREGEGGEATHILEHHINTGNSPISVPPYRMSPVKNCPDCIKYKASNQKPSGLLQTPVPAQRFETLAIDLFGPLPEKKLPFIRFALSTAKCETTGQTAAFLNFGRELRTPSEVANDIRVVIQNNNFVPEITPYLKKFAKFSTQIREVVEEQQDSRKFYADKKRKTAPTYQPGEHVFVVSHPLSNAAQGRSAQLMPRRDGPCYLKFAGNVWFDSVGRHTAVVFLSLLVVSIHVWKSTQFHKEYIHILTASDVRTNDKRT
ncbi:tyrosine-protein kinase CSK [Trichonephila clavipes]|nr:tyrosine-protein kinase CSK [Trichonephila clavipes]